ncbi:MAG: hypothetical protein ACFE0J_10160 [Elainellaceae cyanobacterium]
MADRPDADNTPMQPDNPEAVADAQEDLAENPATDPQELVMDKADPVSQTITDEESQQ